MLKPRQREPQSRVIIKPKARAPFPMPKQRFDTRKDKETSIILPFKLNFPITKLKSDCFPHVSQPLG